MSTGRNFSILQSMKKQLYPLKLYINNLPNRVLLGLGLAVNVLVWGWLAWYISPQEKPIFLHYNILFGVDLIGPWWKVFKLPLIGFLIILVNSIIGWVTFHKDRFISYFLNFISVICQIFLFISAYLLVFLNI